MQEVAVVGLDLAKNVFQVYGVCVGGAVVRRQLRRAGAELLRGAVALRRIADHPARKINELRPWARSPH